MSAGCDIAVVGAGAAGLAAAVTSARAGARTLLLDQAAGPGGTGGHSGLTTLCGLFDEAGQALNTGFPAEFAAAVAESPPRQAGRVWVLPYRPATFRAVAAGFLAALPNLISRWQTPLTEVVLTGGHIRSLNGIPVGAVVDCSGEAEVARGIGAPCLATDESTQASAVIFQLCDVPAPPRSPAEAARILLPVARAGFAPLSLQPELEAGTLTAKFGGPVEQVPALIDFLRREVSGFAGCACPSLPRRAARRAGRMIIGAHVLTGAEVLSAARFPDAIARGAWPVEQWSADGVRYRYLPSGAHYEIPARCLRAAGVANLFMAGKTLSADETAIASARVMGCGLATGAAAGQLAVDHLNSRHPA